MWTEYGVYLTGGTGEDAVKGGSFLRRKGMKCKIKFQEYRPLSRLK